MSDFFIIPNNKLDPNWSIIDLGYEVFALDYCEEVLDIPLLYIEDTMYEGSGLEVALKNLNKELVEEDWYIQLYRIAKAA